MFPIIEAQQLAPEVKRFRIEAPRIAAKQKAGQFVIVRIHVHGERIPLTIAESDEKAGTITLIVQGVGKTTKLFNGLESGDAILDLVGPLGNPSEIEAFGTVVVIGGGVGTAIAYPTAAALKQAGNHVIGVIGAKSRDYLILEEAMRETTDELFCVTDDGSYGQHGMVTGPLLSLLEEPRQIDRVLAIGPIPMMRAVAELTRPHDIRTIVSLNPIMVDGTGMCGGCRVLVGGKSRFACVEGPEFDAHLVDFDTLRHRNQLYRHQEHEALLRFEQAPDQEVAEIRQCQLQEQHPELANG